MNESDRDFCIKLRRLSSSEAAKRIIEEFPNDGCRFVSKRSWEKKEQKALATHFLRTIPHASSAHYRSLLSAMAVSTFVSVLREFMPDEESDRDLLRYHVYPELNRAAKSPKDQEAILELRKLLN